MAEELLQNVLQALQQAHQGRRAAAQLALEQQKADIEKEQKQKEYDLQVKQFDENTRQFNLHQKAAAALNDVMVAEHKRNLAAQTFGSPEQQSDMAIKQQEAEAVQGPGSPAARSHIAALQEQNAGEMKLHEMEKAYDYQKAIEQKAADETRAEMQRQSAEKVANIQAGARLGAANINASSRLSAAKLKQGPEIDSTPYLHGLMDGTYTRDDILKTMPNKQQAAQVLGQFVGMGGVSLNDKQKDSLENLSQITPVLPKMQEFNQLLQQHEVLARTPGTAEYKRANELRGEIKQYQVKYAKVIEGLSGRISNQQMESAKQAFEPSTSILGGSTVENENKRKAVEQTLHQYADQTLNSQPIAQRGMIKQKLGLLPSVSQAPAQPQVQQQPATPTVPQKRVQYYDVNGNPITQPGGQQ